jgi:hypothetical protein
MLTPLAGAAQTPDAESIPADALQHLTHEPGKRPLYKFSGKENPFADMNTVSPVHADGEIALSPTELTNRAASAMVESLRVTSAFVAQDAAARTVCINHRPFHQGDELPSSLLPKFDGRVTIDTIASGEVTFKVVTKGGSHTDAKLTYGFYPKARKSGP